MLQMWQEHLMELFNGGSKMDEQDDEGIAANSPTMADQSQCVAPTLRETKKIIKYL